MTALEIAHVSKRFGGLVANDDVTFAVEEGEIVGVIGPNGAGKTTLFNCLAGYMHPEGGQIRLYGREITRRRPDQICKLGVSRTWQLVRIFRRMSVLDNVICGALNRARSTDEARELAQRLVAFAGLRGNEHASAGSLPLADKKRLEIARALATRPRVLLLDEAMSGLTPAEAAAAVDFVRLVHREFRREFARDASPMTICVVEHVMEVIMPLSHRVVVLNYGRVIAEGSPEAVARDELVIKAYLGQRYRARGH
ncbi:MAG TPA: ABC transporter ATP-binding protein [bacterium]|nr:ABC transporter ATP-binding protein [bacterium]